MKYHTTEHEVTIERRDLRAMAALVFFYLVGSILVLISCEATNLYLAPSKVAGAGLGVFTYEEIQHGSRLEGSLGLLIDDYLTQEINLVNYVYQSHYNYYAATLFGIATLINHQVEENSNIERVWLDNETVTYLPSTSLRPYSTYPNMYFTAKRTIQAGEELFVTYGGDEYFRERSTTETYGADVTSKFDQSKYQYSPLELAKVGHPLSGLSLAASKLPNAGKGIFSKVEFSSGDTVYISPALAVPKHLFLDAGRTNLLINYCFSENQSDIALLPLGTTGVINHGGQLSSNIGIRWYDWSHSSEEDRYKMFKGDLTGIKSSPFYIEYYALKPIQEGEELLLDYGSSWEEAWLQYLDALSYWTSMHGLDGISMLNAPQFRHPIGAPEGLFPNLLKKKCVGSRYCKLPSKERRPNAVHSMLNDIGLNHRLNQETIHLSKKYIQRKSSKSKSNTVSMDGELLQGHYSEKPRSKPCGLYLAPIDSVDQAQAQLKQATAVFAGVPIRGGTIVEASISVLLSKELRSLTKSHQNYMSPSGRLNYELAYLGHGSHMREGPNYNMNRRLQVGQKEEVPSPANQALRPYTIYTNVMHSSERDIPPGTELLLPLEGLKSIKPQHIDLNMKAMSAVEKPLKYNYSRLQEIGHCLTDIYIEKSQIPLGANGVFSELPYITGARVSISQAIVIPKHALLEHDESVLINYCFSSSSSDVAILPLGSAGVMNHGGKTRSNVGVRWFDWKGRGREEVLKAFQESSSSTFSSFRIAPLYLEYYALKPIQEGEELLLDYGSFWEEAWLQYLDALSYWTSKHGLDGISMLNAPQFRHPIGAPEGLFPEYFADIKCLDSTACSKKGSLRTFTYKNSEFPKLTTGAVSRSRASDMTPKREGKRVGSAFLKTPSKEFEQGNKITSPPTVVTNTEGPKGGLLNSIVRRLVELFQ